MKCEDASSFTSNEEVDSFRAYFSKRMSIVQTTEGEERKEETEKKTIPSKVIDKEVDVSEVSEEQSEGEEDIPVISRVPKAESMQFFEEDDGDDDIRDLDLLTVKRRNIFGSEANDSSALVSASDEAYESNSFDG